MAETESVAIESNQEAEPQERNDDNVVPLYKMELVLGGISNLIIVTMAFIFEIWIDFDIGSHNAITNRSQLTDFGEYIAAARTAETLQLGVFLFLYPLYVWWYTAMMRVLKICYPEYHGCRTMFSFSYVVFVVFLYMAAAVGILWQAFFWSIQEDTTNEELPSTDLLLLFMYRLEFLLVSLATYFAAIMMIAFWIPFIYALLFDAKYKNNLKIYMLPSCCNNYMAKIFLIILIILTLITSYLFIYSWQYNGFWSLTGGSQGFQLFTIFSATLSGVWLIWFAVSTNYLNFNQRLQFKQFL